jgi:uncharacterized protein (TIGR02117 family)
VHDFSTRTASHRVASTLSSTVRFTAKIAAGCVAVVLVGLVGYLLAAVVGAAITLNADAAEPDAGTEIWLRSNGVHVELVMPVETPSVDWQAEFPMSAFVAPPRAPRWVAFGWGARDFYVNVREWRDLTAARALRALLLAPGVLHVEYLPATGNPASPGAGRRLLVSAAQLDALVAYVRATAIRDADGRPVPLPGVAYGNDDAFFEANGRYSPMATCNEWVNVALKRAGVRTVAWAPFAPALVR